MSGLSDFYSSVISTGGKIFNAVNKYNPVLANYHVNDTIEKFIQDEVIDKSELRGAELESIASGLPFIGPLVRGIDGVNQLEDLYNNTGKVPKYPALGASGASGIGKSIGGVARKIENGVHDLASYYAGERIGLPVEGVDYVTGDKYVNQ